jgi:uncharacterized protein YndB with AHSA1/START domain
MTAVADVAVGTVHAVVEIAAPPEKVFHALTDPRELAAWWGSDDTYRSFDWQIELRTGGKWSCRTRNARDGGQMSVRGEYLVVEPPRLLVCTWLPSWENFAPTTIRYELEATAKGTRLSVTHTGFASRAACESHAQGWTQVLAWLSRRAEANDAGAAPTGS